VSSGEQEGKEGREEIGVLASEVGEAQRRQRLDGLVGGKQAPQYMREERSQEASGARWQESHAQGLSCR